MGGTEIKHYPYLIVGGGVVGAGILRDLSLHGEQALLLERGDFAAQTSSGSSKMLHGGIRYLEQMDFFLVHEALTEKNLWQKLAPHITHERNFYLPIYKESKYPLWMIRIGLFLYDLLSLFRNSSHKVLNKQQAQSHLSSMKQAGLKGAGMYSDAVVDDTRLAIDCILCATTSEKCQAKNYEKIIKVDSLANGRYKVTSENQLTFTQEHYSCDKIIFATGPFTDQVMHELNIPWQDIILPSKGVHLWLKAQTLDLKDPVVLQTKDGRIIFVIPQQKGILVGTTEATLDKDDNFYNIECTSHEITYLLDNLNEYFPQAKITNDNIIATTAAVRPLVRNPRSKNAHKTSRHHQIFSPQKNMYVIAGGKYTTFRVMARDLVKKIFKSENKKYYAHYSKAPLRKISRAGNITNFQLNQQSTKDIIREEMPKTSEDLIIRRLGRLTMSAEEKKKSLKDFID